MKRMIWIMWLQLIATGSFMEMQAKPQDEDRSGNRLTILCEESLSEVAGTWADAYEKDHPGTRVTVAIAGKEEMKEKLSKKGTVALVSSECIGDVRSPNCRTVVVGRDVLVPVTSADNPFLEEIMRAGLSPVDFGRIYSQGQEKSWGTILGDGKAEPVRTCVVAATTGISGLAEFLRVDEGLLQECLVQNHEAFTETIREDKYSLGFCRLCDITSCETGEVEGGLVLVPIDANGNGTIDHFERIYRSPADLARGVWIGKYPDKLFSRIYAVTGAKGAGDAELAFLEWTLADGQSYLAGAGLNGLLGSERRVSLDRIRDLGMPPAAMAPSVAQFRNYLVTAVLILAGLILLWLIARTFLRRKPVSERISVADRGTFGESRLSMPQGLFFDRSHTWVFMEKNGEVRVGLDDFLPHVTGPVTRLRMKRAGEQVKKGEAFLTLVQNGKQVSIPSPVSGVVREHNSRLNTEPGLVNRDPLSDGWVYQIQPLNWMEEMKSYYMGENYREWIGKEFGRLRDFLASILVPAEMADRQPVLQDGGEIREGVLEYFGPTVWEDFQFKFIDIKG